MELPVKLQKLVKKFITEYIIPDSRTRTDNDICQIFLKLTYRLNSKSNFQIKLLIFVSHADAVSDIQHLWEWNVIINLQVLLQ